VTHNIGRLQALSAHVRLKCLQGKHSTLFCQRINDKGTNVL
jgi:hypothetical protein